jgi:hypothetical protein
MLPEIGDARPTAGVALAAQVMRLIGERRGIWGGASGAVETNEWRRKRSSEERIR